MKRAVFLLLCLIMCLGIFASCTAGMEDVNVKIIEATLHRKNPEGVLGTKDFPYGAAVTDSDIKTNAAGYDDYVAQQGNTVHPGFVRLKEVYVENLSNTDVYVRVIATFPAVFCKKDARIMDIYYSEEAAKDSEKGFTVAENYDSQGNYVLTFTYNKPVAPGALTYWPSLEAFGISSTVSYDQISEAFNALGGKPFDVGVVANAITADGYATAEEAFADYDKNAIE